MTELALKPEPGLVVHVRQRRYLVEAVDSTTAGTRVHLACLEDDSQGQPLQILWEAELDAELLPETRWDHLATRGFDQPQFFSAYLHTLRWNCVTATNPRLFQAPFRAGIRLDAYQLEPLQKALLLPRVNLFIADDVGLGKTIEAGLIARELLLRKKVRDIVVVCPPSVLPQWQDELEARFGLGFEVLDKDYITRVRRERGFGTNPWATHNRFLISQRLLVDENYTALLRDWLTDFRPGSLLILDEAHHAAPASASRYAIDSKITRAVRDIAPRFEHRLFLSATPHNGHSNSFSALLEILDPQRFCRGVPVQAKKLQAVMVRRLKEDIREIGIPGFPRRQIEQIDIDGLPKDAPELRLSVLLDQYRQARENRLSDASKKVQAVAALLVTGLQQRLLSSIEAFARTLKVHRVTAERQSAVTKPEPNLLGLLWGGVSADDDQASLSEDDLQREEDTQIEAASAAVVGLPANEAALLKEMSRIAENARAETDPRVQKLIDWIRGNLCPDKWNERRVIVFTEYEDTLRYLRQQLDVAIEDTERASERIEVYRGATPQATREDIKRAFNGDPAKYPLRILLCTDAAREGLNLQTHCADLFHFDIPWNPSRMEQRNGRIDRKLQPSAEVRCHYFVLTQRVEDRVLRALVRKTEIIRKELGSLSRVVEGRLVESLDRGIRHDLATALVDEIDTADLDHDAKAAVSEELEATRERQDELRKQVETLRDRLEESREATGIDGAHFRAALSASLEMMKAEPLKEESHTARCLFPALDQQAGADPSWADTLDALRVPRKRDQKFWDWRRESPLRPVVFEDPGTITEDVVHLHLEHPVVQRLLGRFTAQGFVYDDLSRACLAQTKDSIRRVALIGRLSLYGTGAARLHEELVYITARWTDPQTRTTPLEPFAEKAAEKTQQLIETALLQSKAEVGDVVQKLLQATASRDVAELLPVLKQRGEELAEGATLALKERGEKEATAMRSILEDQRNRIAATVEKNRDTTLNLFNQDEMQQLNADRRHWDKRLAAIDDEIASEPARIRAVYTVMAKQIEPVGLVYLWPVSG